MRCFFIILFLFYVNFTWAKIESVNEFKCISHEIIDTYIFKINSKSFQRNNVIKLTFYSSYSSLFETSYIYESADGLEKIYHDFNKDQSIVQRLYYKFPTSKELNQFLVTGDMKFNSYLSIDMDIDFLGHNTTEGFSIIDGKIKLEVQGKDLVYNNFEIDSNALFNVDLDIPYLISKN